MQDMHQSFAACPTETTKPLWEAKVVSHRVMRRNAAHLI